MQGYASSIKIKNNRAETVLQGFLQTVYYKTPHTHTQYRRAVSSPSLHHVPQSPLTPANKKLFEREQIFADFGQRLKVEKIIRGHHPTSQRTTVATKKDVSGWGIPLCIHYTHCYNDSPCFSVAMANRVHSEQLSIPDHLRRCLW